MFSCATGAPRSLYLLCAIALLLVVPVRSNAQSTRMESGMARTAVAGGAESDTGQLRLLVGRSTVVNVGQPILRLSLTRPEIADALVTGNQQILVHGKTPGTISMFVWDRSGGIKRYDVTVARDLTQLGDQLKQLFPGEPITVTGNGKDVVVSGTVSSKYIIDKAAEVAAGYVEKKEDVVNLLRQQEGIATDQVLLRVRFAEVSRSALTELGLNMFSDGNNNTLGSSTTQQFAAPFFDQNKAMVGKTLVFSDYLNLFLFDMKNQLGLTIRALQNRGLLQSLAEPNLIAQNGKEASFLAGGEYPYPVVQGSGSFLAVTIVFKEYGIRLNFTPTLMGGDLIHLKVKPEVSSLDFANAITYQGFRIPALSTRRADTEVELQDGQTFAIAGLMNNTVTSTMSKIPGIGDIPILGLLFRSKSAKKDQTELVVMITPQIVRRGGMGAGAGLPNITEPYLPALKKVMPQPPARLPGAPPRQDDNNNRPDPAPVASAPAPQASEPAQPAAPVSVAAPVSTAVTPAAAPPPASAPVFAPTPSSAPPRVDEKQVAEQRKAAERTAEQQRKVLEQERRAADERRVEEQKAAERAAKELKAKQEADARLRAQKDAEDARRREADAKAAGERKRAEARAAEEQRRVELKRAEEAVKAEKARLEQAQKQGEESRKQEEKLAKERAKRDAELAKRASDLQKRQAEAEKKRVKEIQEAVDRLNAAQAAYQAAVDKSKKTGGQ